MVVLGCKQPTPRLLHFYLTNFSTGHLVHALTLLGRDVKIVAKPTPALAA